MIKKMPIYWDRFKYRCQMKVKAWGQKLNKLFNQPITTGLGWNPTDMRIERGERRFQIRVVRPTHFYAKHKAPPQDCMYYEQVQNHKRRVKKQRRKDNSMSYRKQRRRHLVRVWGVSYAKAVELEKHGIHNRVLAGL